MKTKALFLFRRDLRLQDNTALLHALEVYDEVLPVFIFTPEQVSTENSYKGSNIIQFMMESLQEVDKALREHGSKLFCFYGSPLESFEQIVAAYRPQAVYSNEDYTPYARLRDEALRQKAESLNVQFNSYEDGVLFPVETIKSNDGKPYTIFTHFKNKAEKLYDNIPVPVENNYKNYALATTVLPGCFDLEESKEYVTYDDNKHILVRGGRSAGLQLLSLEALKRLKNYEVDRNDPSKKTSYLSAYNKFCPVSIREVFYALKEHLGVDHPLVRQLIWREFFYVLAYHFPQVFTQNFNEKYKDLQQQWYEDENDFYFNKWKYAQTGFPFVDAGMRELNETGWMHNRLRMVTANFLCKDLFIDWKKGERYFAQLLVDYDPCVNNGNWQWNAGTGADPEKYGGPRIFNPWLQSEKFDPDARYIKKWIPELQTVPAKHIHAWNKHYQKYPHIDYPKPLVDHAVQARKARELYASFKKKI